MWKAWEIFPAFFEKRIFFSGDRFVAVRHSPQCNASVFVSQSPSSDFFSTPVINDRYQITLPWTTDRTIILPPFRKWENLPAGFKQLKLDKMDGKNLMNKIELLMAALSNSQWCESDHVNYMYENNQTVVEIKYTSFPTMTSEICFNVPYIHLTGSCRRICLGRPNPANARQAMNWFRLMELESTQPLIHVSEEHQLLKQHSL